MQDFVENNSKMELMKIEFTHVDKLEGEMARVKAELAEAIKAKEGVASQVADLKKRVDEAEEKLKTVNSKKEALEVELSAEKIFGLK